MSSEYSSDVFTKPLSKRSLFSSVDRSALRKYLSSSKTSLDIPEEVQHLRKVKYQKVSFSDSSTEDEAGDEKESHVDSEDSGLFKEGYFLQRSSTRLGKSLIDQEVNAWKRAAEKNVKELNNDYNKGSKKMAPFDIPLGLEMNGKVGMEISDEDSTFVSKSLRTSKMDSENEADLRRNDEFMREVKRALRTKKDPETLAKRSLEEEYDLQLSKKMSAVCRWAHHRFNPNTGTEKKALAESENISNTDTGAGGDNTSGGAAQGIFEQLAQMVLKNKISKTSKAARTRKQILKRAEEKRENLVELSKFSEVEEDQIKIPKGDKQGLKKVRFLDEFTEPDSRKSPPNVKIKNSGDNEDGVQRENSIAVYTGTHINEIGRVNKVESYLAAASNRDSSSSGEDDWNDEVLTPEKEKYVFDGLAGEFLKTLRTQRTEQGKVGRNDKKLLTFLVKKFMERGELCAIDEMLGASVDDCKMKIPPYENVKDREQYFLRMLIRKYIKRGMRTILEDKIAWIYYKTEALKNKSKESSNALDESLKNGDVQRLVKAFGSSGGNSSLNRLVEDLVQERLRGNANMKEVEIADARFKIHGMVVSRFARMFLEGTTTESSIMKEHHTESTEGVTDTTGNMKYQKGIEQFDMNGKPFEVQWVASGGSSASPNIDVDDHLEENSPENNELQKKDGSFRLQDRFWNKQKRHLTQSSGKIRRFCTPVLKREISLIGGSKRTPKSCFKTKSKPTSSLENLRKRLRNDNVRWLTEQKNKLWEARNQEAKSIDKFTMSLPQRMEQIIQTRNRFQKELIDRESIKLKGSRNRKSPRP